MTPRWLLCFAVTVVLASGQPQENGGQNGAVNSCPTIHVSQEVSVNPPTCTHGPNPSGTVCHFSCQHGYRVNGPSLTVCHDDGSWLFGQRHISCLDRDECRFRKGGCSHKCVNTVGGYHCRCPHPLVLGKDGHTCRAVGLVLNCTDHNIQIIIPKYALTDLHGDYLQLRDPKCHAHENKTHYVFNTPLTGCGTTRRHTKNFIVYSNKVTEKTVTQHGLITRIGEGEFRIPFCCYYLDNGIVSSVGFKPFARELVLKEKGYGRFKLRMDFFHSANYQSHYTWDDFPVSVYLRERLHFEVSIDSIDQNLVVFAGNCCSTPTRDHQKAGRFRHEIIHEGCIVDSTTQAEPSSSGHKQRFSIEAFKFIGKFPFVYLHCSVIVCKADDPNSRCSKGCIPGIHRGKPMNSPAAAKRDDVTSDHVVRKAAIQRHHKDSLTRSTRAAVKTTHAKKEHKYMLSRGPVSVIEDEPEIIRLKAPNKKPSADEKVPVEKVPVPLNKAEKEPKRKRKHPANKGSKKGAGATNVLLIILTTCTLFALVGLIYLGAKIKRASSRAQPGYEPMKS